LLFLISIVSAFEDKLTFDNMAIEIVVDKSWIYLK